MDANFPRGQVSLDGTPSRQMTNYTHKLTNGAKLKPTLRRRSGGIVTGARAITGSMEIAVDDGGEELDFDAYCSEAIPMLIVLKLPGNIRKILDVTLTEVGEDITMEDGVKKPISFTGWFADDLA